MTSTQASAQTDARSFSGEETFAAPPERVFGALIDPDVLARCIPDLVSAQRVDNRTLQCTIKPGFSFIRAKMKMTVVLNDIDAARRSATIDIASKGIGASMQVQCRLVVSDRGGAARVAWEANVVELGGLIAAVSPALIRGAADKVIHDGWSALRPIVETPAA